MAAGHRRGQARQPTRTLWACEMCEMLCRVWLGLSHSARGPEGAHPLPAWYVGTAGASVSESVGLRVGQIRNPGVGCGAGGAQALATALSAMSDVSLGFCVLISTTTLECPS